MGEGKNLVGIDIGSSSIKICQIKPGRGVSTVVRAGYIDLPRGAVVDGQIVQGDIVATALQRALSEAKVKEKNIAVSMSGHSVIIRKITVPLMTPSELAEQIGWEAEQHIPFDINDVQVDYQVLRRREDDNQMDLLLVAAKKEQIEAYSALFKSVKLKPFICDIDSFAVQNVYESSRGLPPNQTIALLNVGASVTSLNIIASGISAFTREIANAGYHVTEALARKSDTSFELAEMYKIGAPVAEGQGAAPADFELWAEEACDGIAAEVQRSIDFFMATSGEESISMVALTGGSANLPILAQAIERRTRIQTEVWSPFEKLEIDPKAIDLPMLEKHAAQFSVAIGLAFRKSREVSK